MMKILKKSAILLLAVLMLFSSLAGCKPENGGGDSGGTDPVTPTIKDTENDLIINGASDYRIVIETDMVNDRKGYEASGANEIKDNIKLASNVELNVVEASAVTVTETSKLIIVGDTTLTQAAGITADKNTYGVRGFVIKTVDSNVYIVGGDPMGTLYGCYEFLHYQFGYEPYAWDEIALEMGVLNKKLMAFDLKEIPDIAQIQSPHGYWSSVNNPDRRMPGHRMRFNDYDEIFTAGDDQPWHNTFAMYVNPETYYGDHPEWYIKGPGSSNNQIHYTAHGNKTELKALEDTVYDKMVSYIDADYAAGKEYTMIGFMAQDGTGWASEDAYDNDGEGSVIDPATGEVVEGQAANVETIIHPDSGERVTGEIVSVEGSTCTVIDPATNQQVTGKWVYGIESIIHPVTGDVITGEAVDDDGKDSVQYYKEVYGDAYAAAMLIHFINPLQERITQYMNDNYGGRKMQITIFAYVDAETPPTKIVNGEIVPIDDSVILHPDVNVFIAPIYADYLCDFEESGVKELTDGWKVLAQNTSYWFYDYYFATSNMTHLDSTYSLQSFFQACHDLGGQYVFYETPLNYHDYYVFGRLKVYLMSKLAWDAYADVNVLIDNFFENYYKEAAPYMRQYFDALTAYCAVLIDTKKISGVGGGAGIDSRECWEQSVLEQWIRLMDQAIEAIELVKNTDINLYNTLRDRITYEQLSPRFLLLKHYAKEAFTDDKSFNDEWTQFKLDAANLGVVYWRATGAKPHTFEELTLTRS